MRLIFVNDPRIRIAPETPAVNPSRRGPREKEKQPRLPVLKAS
jgi:hypothetical protein